MRDWQTQVVARGPRFWFKLYAPPAYRPAPQFVVAAMALGEFLLSVADTSDDVAVFAELARPSIGGGIRIVEIEFVTGSADESYMRSDADCAEAILAAEQFLATYGLLPWRSVGTRYNNPHGDARLQLLCALDAATLSERTRQEAEEATVTATEPTERDLTAIIRGVRVSPEIREFFAAMDAAEAAEFELARQALAEVCRDGPNLPVVIGTPRDE